MRVCAAGPAQVPRLTCPTAIGCESVHLCNIIEAPWLVNGGHGASLRHHNVAARRHVDRLRWRSRLARPSLRVSDITWVACGVPQESTKPAKVMVTGPHAAVEAAKAALRELCTKGYASCMQVRPSLSIRCAGAGGDDGTDHIIESLCLGNCMHGDLMYTKN
eukprot:COSAG01_NODE_2307_length_7944_cov_31.370045_1_plen_162_part_00